MKTFIYSVHDDKTGFNAPFMDANDDSAIRGFTFAFKSNTGLMSFAPSDFRLYRIGSFDTQTGVLVPDCPPVVVSDLATLIRKDVENEK